MLIIMVSLSAVLNALMAGVYGAFSVVVMPSLTRIPPEQGAGAMQQINRDILRSAFMLLFWGSSLLSLAMVFIGHSTAVVLAGSIYLVGMLVVTALRNVPLNERLERATGDTLVSEWQHYLVKWTFWNHVRAMSALVSAILLLTSA